MKFIGFSSSSGKLAPEWIPFLARVFVKRSPYWLSAIIALAIFAGGAVLPRPGTPRGTKGAYDLAFAGAYSGTGNGIVAAKSMTIIGHVTNTKTGITGKLVASHLALYDGRFNGTGRVSGVTVTLSGRVQAADGNLVRIPCIFCNFGTNAPEYGRIMGQRKGP